MYPRSSDPFYIVSYYIELITSSWTDGMLTQLPSYIPVTMVALNSMRQSSRIYDEQVQSASESEYFGRIIFFI